MTEERDIQLKALQEKVADNKKAGDEYRAENAKKSGVKTLDNGIQYKVITDRQGQTG